MSNTPSDRPLSATPDYDPDGGYAPLSAYRTTDRSVSEDVVKEHAHVELLGHGAVVRASLVWNGRVLSGVGATESGARKALTEVLEYRRHFDGC